MGTWKYSDRAFQIICTYCIHSEWPNIAMKSNIQRQLEDHARCLLIYQTVISLGRENL